jgi:uncharacterized membrane protein
MSLFTKTPKVDDARVVAAITAAELKTSGEIRVLVAKEKAEDPIAAAKWHFEHLGMTKTKLRNGVLIYVAPASRKFAIIGDTGIHEKCGDAFWRLIAAAMETHFRREDFTGGLIHGIEKTGAILGEYFPRRPDDTNELPNAVVR